jgi:glycosyltransferase involved in cell wall biosynthesis
VLLIGNSRGWGLTYYNAVLALAMQREGVPVVVMSTAGDQTPGLHERLRAGGITVLDDPAFDVQDLGAVWRAARVIAEAALSGLNIVHTEGVRHAVAARLARRLLPRDKQLAVTTVLGAMRHCSRLWPLYYAAGAATLNVASDRVFLLSADEKRKMINCGLRRYKAGVAHFIVDDGAFARPSIDTAALREIIGDDRVLDPHFQKAVYLAQFRESKRQKSLLHAWKTVRSRFPRLLLVLAGSGPLFQECRDLAAALGIADQVCVLPRIPREAVPALLSLCSYAVVPSRAETFGSCIVEPLLAGLPVCTTRVGVACELAAAGGVHILEKTDPGSLAAELLDFFSTRDQQLDRMRIGRQWVLDHCAESRFVAKLRESWREFSAQGLLDAAVGEM